MKDTATRRCVCHEGSVCTEGCEQGKCHDGCSQSAARGVEASPREWFVERYCGVSRLYERGKGADIAAFRYADENDALRIANAHNEIVNTYDDLRAALAEALRKGRHGPMCDKARCVCWKAAARAALEKTK